MDILAKLFGGAAKVKIMRLFLLNPELGLPTDEVAKRAKVTNVMTAKELNGLANLGLLHKSHKNNALTWHLDRTFPFVLPLRNLLKNNLLNHKKGLAREIGACGRLQLLILSGVFLDDEGEEGRVDLLIVGNGMKRGAIDKVIKKLEAEIGRELNYAVLDTTDFKYRLNACDKFTRDILDYPHEVVIDKIGI